MILSRRLMRRVSGTAQPPEFVSVASTQNASSGYDLIINKPAGTIEGDLMFSIRVGDTISPWEVVAGWTVILLGGEVEIAYKVAGASEPSSYTWTCTRRRSFISGSHLTYRYAAYDTIGAVDIGNDPMILPSISPSVDNSILIAVGKTRSEYTTLETPIGMTARVIDNDIDKPSYIVCDEQVDAGATGTRSMSTSGDFGHGLLLSIKPI